MLRTRLVLKCERFCCATHLQRQKPNVLDTNSVRYYYYRVECKILLLKSRRSENNENADGVRYNIESVARCNRADFNNDVANQERTDRAGRWP
jgi:hypothetical protein